MALFAFALPTSFAQGGPKAPAKKCCCEKGKKCDGGKCEHGKKCQGGKCEHGKKCQGGKCESGKKCHGGKCESGKKCDGGKCESGKKARKSCKKKSGACPMRAGSGV